jgi:hypothetical protein
MTIHYDDIRTTLNEVLGSQARPEGPMTHEQAKTMGLLGDALDQYDLTRAILAGDQVIAQIRAIQIVHTQNLCRIVSHIEAEGLADTIYGYAARDRRLALKKGSST